MARIAIAGNPNAGKSSIFNHLTGTLQQVSNYPGVTVEKKEGTVRFNGNAFIVVDLPGTYSLTAYSQEELIARDFVIEEAPDVVIDVVDASNLERNLYLAIQFMEMRAPLVIALNMSDVASKRGLHIDAPLLGRLLGAPVIPTVGRTGEGLDDLMEACARAIAQWPPRRPAEVAYGHEVDQEVDRLASLVAGFPPIAARYDPRWVAVKLIEKDEAVSRRLPALSGEGARQIAAAAEKAIRAIEKHCDDDAATVIAERRYGFAAGAVKECVTLTGEARQDMTGRIDTLVCNRALGPVILVAVVAALFFTIFKLADEWAWIPWFGGWQSPVGAMQWIFERLAQAVSGLQGPAPMLHSLIADAIIRGVGGVMGYVPLIFFMFLFISALEDSGYIARVAFLMDRVLRAFGLQGKSILAMIVSGGLGAGGCAVPGVMATRTLREEKDRLVTMLVAPFMNCGAKMPVYAMLIAAFFPNGRARMMLLLWAISWAVALCAAWVLRRFVIRGEQTPFVMELPPYHVPTLRGALTHTWERTGMYLKKAGTIILAVNIVVWAFMYFPRLPESGKGGVDAMDTLDALDRDRGNARTSGAGAAEKGEGPGARQLSYTFAGRLGRTLEPVSRLAGFDWKINIALIGGFAAKEVVIGTLGTVYSMNAPSGDGEAESLSARIAADPGWNRLKAFTLMLFVMIYAPCFVTMTVIRRESGSWKWAFFSTLYSTSLAFVLATLVYQIGLAFGWGL